MLAGCADVSQLPNAINTAVDDTQTVATGAVGIATDLIKIGVALINPVTSIISIVGSLSGTL